MSLAERSAEPAEYTSEIEGRFGVGDGIRTHDSQIHSLELYRLSYTHRTFALARLEGLEPPTHGLEGRCSFRLSYRRVLQAMATLTKGCGPRKIAGATGYLVRVAGFEPATPSSGG